MSHVRWAGCQDRRPNHERYGAALGALWATERFTLDSSGARSMNEKRVAAVPPGTVSDAPSPSESSTRLTASNVLGALLLAAAAVAGIAFAWTATSRADEHHHRLQIINFARLDWILSHRLPQLPGYHLLLAGLARWTGWTTLASLRSFSILFSAAAVWAFHRAVGELHRGPRMERVLQFAFLPVLFPFLFLLYTDAMSALFVLLMLLYTRRGRVHVAGVVGLLACLVRQNNIVWVALALALSYVDASGWRWMPLREASKKYAVFIFTGALFVAFVVVHGGVALGDAPKHPMSLHLQNVFFLLFLSFFFFLPTFYAWRSALRSRLGSPRTWLALAGLFVLFWFTFVIDHPYNTQWTDYFLRNRLLAEITASPTRKALSFAPIAVAVLGFSVTPLAAHWWLIYPSSVVFLAPSWLVEERYYIIPMSLFLLARKPVPIVAERVQAFIYVACSSSLLWLIHRNLAFP